MAVRLGNIEPVDFYMGSTPVEELRLGEQLVWKRRLIEGRDYEKFDRLYAISGGKLDIAYIDTNIYINDTYEYEIEGKFQLYRNTDSGNGYYAFGIGSFNDGVSLNCDYVAASGSIRVSSNPIVYTGLYRNSVCTFVIGSRAGVINGKEYTYNRLNNTLNRPIYIYDVNPRRNAAFGNFWYFNIKKDGEYVLKLTPCQLLRTIPASLDSQGVSRPAGECGMIDEVTGLFFGNANTTGSFTVSND